MAHGCFRLQTFSYHFTLGSLEGCVQTAWKGVNKSLKCWRQVCFIWIRKFIQDELISLRKNQIKFGLFFLGCISKPSSSGGDMPGCHRNSTVTRNLEIRHETIIFVFHWHALHQWTSETGINELDLNGRVDIGHQTNPIPSTKYPTPLPIISAHSWECLLDCDATLFCLPSTWSKMEAYLRHWKERLEHAQSFFS